MTKITRLVRRFVGFYQARGRDPEIEQAWLRVAIASLAFGWTLYLIITGSLTPGLMLALAAAGGAALVGLVMIVMLSRSHDHAVLLRFVGIFTDMTAISVGMAGADEGGVPLIGAYLWVTVGNGFRFGPRYLLAAYWLQSLGFALQLLLVPFWIEHRAIGVGLLLALTIVPLYVLVLLSRLTAQKDAAEQLSNAKSRFVANVSHELRTPLTGVFAVHDLLRSRKLTPDERELVGMLGKAIANLKTSVDAVLQMSKLEAGAERANNRRFSLWFFLHQIESLTRPQAVSKNIAWAVHVHPEVPSVIVSDPDHLSHVLGNLLSNAFKFTSKGSVTLQVSATNDRLRFQVIDTGIGIPLDHQEKLFERFVQVDDSAGRRFGGTGLGTSIARDLVELMGGRIGVISMPGQGSTFWIELPLSLPDDLPATSPQTPEWGTRNQVLVVGEESAQRNALIATLGSLGVHGIAADSNRPRDFSAGDLRKCLAVILSMSAGAAAQFLQSVSNTSATSICPWVVATTESSDQYIGTLIKAGIAAIVQTPVNEVSLRDVLAALVNRLELPDGRADEVSTASTLRKLRILLADDNRSNQLLLARILEDRGHSVITAQRGDEAFDLMATDAIDLAILDLNMPDLTGPEVVKLYRASSVGSTEHLPILILSADATPAARQQSLEAGSDDFLTKPVTAAGLLAAIERVMCGVDARNEPQQMTEQAPTGRNAGTLIDAERLQSLRRISRGDDRFLQTYVSAAFEEIEQALSNLRSAMSANNIRAVRDALHIIEGTGASIGGVALTDSCRALRPHLDDTNDAARAGAVADLSTSYALTKSAVAANLSEPKTGALSSRMRH